MIDWAGLQLETITKLSVKELTKEVLEEVCVLLKERVGHYDWVGIYTMDSDERSLQLLCYDGLPTEHTSIPYGKGICGQVAVSGKALFVDDVDLEDNYISCNANVRSEVVYPIFSKDRLVAQMDIDSNKKEPFGPNDRKLIGMICEQIGDNWPPVDL